MTVVTRFAPSPTGTGLHVGGVRTALFNYLYARHHGGRFLLRIEDTDKERNNEANVQPIIDGLGWLGLHHDGKIVFQSERAQRHLEVAQQLLDRGAAYRCYTPLDALETARKNAQAQRTTFKFESPWRDREPTNDWFQNLEAPPASVIRLKAPRDGETVIDDLVQGRVTVQNNILDDMILVRADGTPTYMLSVVVDDHDAGVTHVIRGDDHLNNAFRQLGIIRAMNWSEPAYAHIPLIHGEDGKKLSKRHGAMGVDVFKDAGILPDAMFNYLLRMGWGHGDHEVFSPEEAIRLFDIDGVGRGAARLDPARLRHLNNIKIMAMTDEDFVREVTPFLKAKLSIDDPMWENDHQEILRACSSAVKSRVHDLVEAADMMAFYFRRPAATVDDPILPMLRALLVDLHDFGREPLEALVRGYASDHDLKVKNVIAPLRMAVTGSKISPPMFEAMAILGKEECLHRIDIAVKG